MKIIFIIICFLSLLAGCMPASSERNGFHHYLKSESLENPTNVMYQAMLFSTKDTGFLAGDFYLFTYQNGDSLHIPTKKKAVCWQTVNGGYTWKQSLTADNAEIQLLRQNKESIYGLVYSKTEAGDSSIIYETKNQGFTWNKKVTLNIFVYDFHFIDSLQGIVYGGANGKGYTFRTTSDGGKKWKETSPGGWAHLQQLDDSMAYYILKPLRGNSLDSNFYLTGWNYIKEKQTFCIKLPHRYLYKYSDGVLAVDNEHHFLSVYELTPDFTLKFLHTFNYKHSRVDYIARHGNKMYIKFNSFMTNYVFFSDDGGKTWHKRNYYSIMSFGPEYVLKDRDTMRFWLMSFYNYITTFKN